MTLQISEDKMAEYRAGYKKRQKAAQLALDVRFNLAWAIAQQGANLLRTQFLAEKVVVFGSLGQRDLFHDRSDIDLAVWGLSEDVYLQSLGVLTDLTTDFTIDLVRFEAAPDRLRHYIETEGILL